MLSEQGYAILTVEKHDEERRTFTGIATTPVLDRDGDIIEPKGVSFANPLPLLLHHDKQRPVGEVRLFPPTAEGVRFEASIPLVTEPGVLKDRTDEAWHSVKYGVLKAVSVRVSAKREHVKKLASGGMHWLQSMVTELSLVTIGANQDALIQTIRSFDQGRPAALGTKDTPVSHTARVRATVRALDTSSRQDAMTPIQEQIKSYESTRAAKVARMNEIMTASATKGETLDQAQADEHDTLETEVKSIDEHLTRLARNAEINKSAAAPVAGDTQEKATASRAGEKSPHVIRVKSQTPPGVAFTRLAMCLAVGKSSRSDAAEVAKSAYPDEPWIPEVIKGFRNSDHMAEAIKAAVIAGSTANGAGPLLQYTDSMADFVEYLRAATIVDRIPGLRSAPFNTRFMSQTAGGTAYWTGQGKPKRVTKGTYSTITLDFHKLACISVLTQEEVKFVPSSEMRVRDDLRAAIAARVDQSFVDPTNAGSAGVEPASVTSGVAATAVSGTDADAVRVDFKNLMSAFITANVEVDSPVFIMSKQIALNLSLMLNALGQREFPDVNMNGGTLFGVPVVTSQYLASGGSPAGAYIILINASDIYYAQEGLMVDSSGEASLEMDDAPGQDGLAGTGASLVSLWQNNLLGIKVERFITWKKRRTTAAQYLSNVAYTPAT
jgi:HK97 family phage major capsid protein